MIEYIRGGIAELSPATAVIDCNGLGYGVNISLNTYAAIQGKKNANYMYTKLSVKTPMSSTDSPTSRNANYSCCSSPFQASAEIQLA